MPVLTVVIATSRMLCRSDDLTNTQLNSCSSRALSRQLRSGKRKRTYPDEAFRMDDHVWIVRWHRKTDSGSKAIEPLTIRLRDVIGELVSFLAAPEQHRLCRS